MDELAQYVHVDAGEFLSCVLVYGSYRLLSVAIQRVLARLESNARRISHVEGFLARKMGYEPPDDLGAVK